MSNVTDIFIKDRAEAVGFAIDKAEKGDIVILAGKGHETYQEIKGVRHPFNEKIVVAELLNEIIEEQK